MSILPYMNGKPHKQLITIECLACDEPFETDDPADCYCSQECENFDSDIEFNE